MKFVKLLNCYFVKLKQGFTLIELMVSLGVLVMAIVSATGVYLNVIGTRERSLGQLHLQEDGQFLMSLIVKDIRSGRVDYDSYTSLTTPEDELYLLDFLSPQNQVRYRGDLASSGNCGASRCILQRCQATSCTTDYQNITMTNSSVERLDFYISPATDPFSPGSTTYEHPRVTIVLRLKSLIEKPGAKDLILQQTVPQRYSQRR
ncbi:prepilin-type N-terminal cleavage/methylation domain-containing protein [Patescibacteria group bacterium AH-259-L07]|nr:prepilin-type N-terminal cleavage/methylation domain-containing protein [Patescibacteria group bacterium AH-259-L07]